MKAARFLSSLILISGVTFVPQARAQLPPLTNGLVAYYPFTEGSLLDATGHGFNLVNSGAVPCPDRFGNSNQAYSFNGGAYLASGTSVPFTETSNWTLVAWVTLGATNASTGFLDCVCLGFDPGSKPEADGFAMGTDGGNQLWGSMGGVGPFAGNYTFLETNYWYQMTLVRSSGVAEFFINGRSTGSSTTLMPLEPTAFTIGSASGTRFWIGDIDDVHLYDVALTTNEIAQLYESESSPCSNNTPATATATIVNGFVVAATVTFGGCGYTNAPQVEIVGGGGTGAAAIAVESNGFIQSIQITDAGSGYTSAPSIFIAPPVSCTPHSATASLTVSNGFVVGVTITDPGCGYTNTPAVQIVGGEGTGATATAVVTNGEILQIIITDAGSGYTSTPGVYVSSPLGVIIGLAQAFVPAFSNLSIGASYQLQTSPDLLNWSNQGPPFTATNSTMYFSQYFNLPNTNQLYFRVQGAQ